MSSKRAKRWCRRLGHRWEFRRNGWVVCERCGKRHDLKRDSNPVYG
jgi:hypothetical protein